MREAESKIERRVKYNIQTSTGEQDLARHRWIFCIINEPREIGRIRERIYAQLSPIVDLVELLSGPIPNSKGLHYNFFSFSSEVGKISYPKKIYDSDKIKKDRNLRECDDVQLERYFHSITR